LKLLPFVLSNRTLFSQLIAPTQTGAALIV
jgi:hypothetical protein